MSRFAFLAFCSVTFTLIVFLNAEQPFVLTDVYGFSRNGSAASKLILADEMVFVAGAPLWGSLSDKIGTRYVAVCGLVLMGVATAFYPRPKTIVPGVLFWRIVFATGASACVSMVTAMLAELSQLTATPQILDEMPLLAAPPEEMMTFKPNGQLSGLTGLAVGIGAIIAVGGLLPLPTLFGYDHDAVHAVRETFWLVGFATLVLAFGFFFILYQMPGRGLRLLLPGNEISIFDEAAMDAGGPLLSYTELLKVGFVAAQRSRLLQLAYFGSVVARAATVVLAFFVPMLVNDWFYKTGQCSVGTGCSEGMVQASILTGVATIGAQFAAVIAGAGILRWGHALVLSISTFLGVVSMLGLILMESPVGVWPICVSVLTGAATIGVITSSMSMCTDRRRDFCGSVAGVYSLCGALGVLLETQLGGQLADRWMKAPFVVMLALYVSLLSFMVATR